MALFCCYWRSAHSSADELRLVDKVTTSDNCKRVLMGINGHFRFALQSGFRSTKQGISAFWSECLQALRVRSPRR